MQQEGGPLWEVVDEHYSGLNNKEGNITIKSCILINMMVVIVNAYHSLQASAHHLPSDSVC